MKIPILSIRAKILEKNIRVFTAREFSALFNVSERRAFYYLERGVEVGLFTQLKRGLYCLKTDPPDGLEIANQLYKPSYISFEYALAFYNVMPEIVYAVTSATSKPTREFVTNHTSYLYHTVKSVAYTGYEAKSVNDKLIFIAEPEKALVDYLYLVSLGQRQLNNRLNVAGLDTQKAKTYAELFKRSSLMSLIDTTFKG